MAAWRAGLARIDHKFSATSLDACPQAGMARFATLQGAHPVSPAHPRRALVEPEPPRSRDENL